MTKKSRLLAIAGVIFGIAQAHAAGPDDMAALLFGKASPGPANGTQKDGTFTLSNNNLKATWAVVGNTLQSVDFTELANGTVHSFAGRNLFRVALAGVPGLPATSGFVPVNLASGDFTLVAPPTLQPIPANPKAVKAADREAGWRISAGQTGGWEDLFAADLSNAQFPEGVWTFSNGELTASEDQVIWTKNDYENFVLDLEFKTGPDANSGVIVYASDKSQWVPNSVEIQLLDDAGPKWAKADPKWKCGAIFGRLAPSQSAVKPTGEWNHCQITCRGPKIDVVLNGQPVTSFDMTLWRSGTENPDGSKMPPWLNKPLSSHPTKGAIGLQGKHGGAPIWFRNIKIKPLG